MEVLRHHDEFLGEYLKNLSVRESALKQVPIYSPEKATEIKQYLTQNGFVKCEDGVATMGADVGLRCSIEGRRSNETPQRQIPIHSFYISRTTVTNLQFEKFDKRHRRTNTSTRDNQPVTCISYGRAISYVVWLNNQTGMNFSLPTEPQLVRALAPDGWHYPYKKDGKPERRGQNVFNSYPELYPKEEAGATLDVDDSTVPLNHLSIYHPTGNVSVFTLGHYTAEGHWGASSDGAYTILMGGNFRTCPYGTRILGRGIADIAAITDVTGIRLAHPDPDNYVK